MMKTFALTYDYLCPFARIANEAVVEMIERGDALDVSFTPFSLKENHAEEGDVPQWDLPRSDFGTGVLALVWSLAVRDSFPESFLAFHVALFSARHDDSADVNDVETLRNVALSVGLDPEAIAQIVDGGVPAKTLGEEHTAHVEDHDVFGVPTFIQGDEAVFVRFMERHQYADVDRVIEMLSMTNLNEFKRTTVSR